MINKRCICEKLRHNCAAVQIPIGQESDLQGLIDLIENKAFYFQGAHGEKIVPAEIPSTLMETVAQRRKELVEAVSEVDDELAEHFLSDEPISADVLVAAIRRATISLKFIPVFMGSAFKNKGVQLLLDGVVRYLPCPIEVKNSALDQNKKEEKIALSGSPTGPLVALAFKLEEGRFGQLTYLRIYQGTMRRGDMIINATTGKKLKIDRQKMLGQKLNLSMGHAKEEANFQWSVPTVLWICERKALRFAVVSC